MELEMARTIIFLILLGALPLLSVSMVALISYYTIYKNQKSDITSMLLAFALMLPSLIILTSIANQIN